MATFVLETPHQNTECQLQGCHESSLTHFTSPLLNAFCRKKRGEGGKYFKKLKQSRRGIPQCQPAYKEVFLIFFFKSITRVTSANLLLTKKKKTI